MKKFAIWILYGVFLPLMASLGLCGCGSTGAVKTDRERQVVQVSEPAEVFSFEDAAVAIPTGPRLITVIGTNQAPFLTRATVAGLLGWDDADVTIITPPVGGGFGGKAYGPVISGLAAIAAATAA